MTTGRSSTAALSEKPTRLFSDLLLHRMGTRRADGITQGVAERDEFRTAPLWGLGQRIFLMHDGRTTDLVEAIGTFGRYAQRGHGPLLIPRPTRKTDSRSKLTAVQACWTEYPHSLHGTGVVAASDQLAAPRPSSREPAFYVGQARKWR